jgi:serine/threonine-protein kinase
MAIASRSAAASWALGFAIVVGSSHAAAQGTLPPGGGPPLKRAEVLFDEGLKLLDARRYAEACPKLEESRRLATGLGVTMYLADCYENIGRKRMALALFREAEGIARSRNDPRADLARDRIKKLEAELPRLSVMLRGDPQEHKTTAVLVDDTPLAPEELNQPLPVDAGRHTVRATTEGRRPFEATIDVPAGGAMIVDIPLQPSPRPPAAPASGQAPATAPTPIVLSDRATADSTQRVIAIAVGASGVAFLVAGTFFGLRAKSKLDESNDSHHCDATNRCDATGLNLRSEGLGAAWMSTASFIVGVAALGTGVVLYFTAPQPTNNAARVSVSPQAFRNGGGASASLSF